jgi:hypothetical protein
MIVLAVVAAAWEISRRRFVYPILLLGWFHLALYSARNVPLLVLVSVAPVASALTAFLARLEEADVAGWARHAARALRAIGARLAVIDLMPRIPVTLVATLLLLGALLWAPPSKRFRVRYSPEAFPVRAAGFLHEAGLLGNLYSADQWGDYLIYRFYPNVRVFTDGRSDFYGPKFGSDFLDVLQGSWRWEAVLNQYHVQTALVRTAAPLAATMKASSRWRLIHDDGIANVFRRADSIPAVLPIAAVENGGDAAIVRSPSINPVIDRSQSYARR